MHFAFKLQNYLISKSEPPTNSKLHNIILYMHAVYEVMNRKLSFRIDQLFYMKKGFVQVHYKFENLIEIGRL